MLTVLGVDINLRGVTADVVQILPRRLDVQLSREPLLGKFSTNALQINCRRSCFTD